jgi:cell division septation protein DedD
VASRSAPARTVTALAALAALLALAGCQDANASAGGSGSPTASPSHSAPACLDTDTTCAVGDVGPGSGIVFYVAPTPQSWGQFLEAPTWSAWTAWLHAGDPPPAYALYPSACTTPAVTVAETVNVSYGLGAANTRAILAACPNSEAAAKASSYAPRVGDPATAITGWYLPSLTETMALLKHAHLLGIPDDVQTTGLLTSRTWERSAYFALLVGGGTAYNDTEDGKSILPVRAFGPTSTPSPSPTATPTPAPPVTHTTPPPAAKQTTPPPVAAHPPAVSVTGDPAFALLHVPSVAHAFTVTNTGGGTLTVGTVTVALTPAEVAAGDGNPFSITANTCTGAALAAGHSCTVTVTVGVVGLYGPNGTLTVPSNAGTSTTPLTASIT